MGGQDQRLRRWRTSGAYAQPDEMEAIQNYEDKDVNSCDVCGGKATETLFEFRCFKRQEHGKDHLNLANRRTYTFVA